MSQVFESNFSGGLYYAAIMSTKFDVQIDTCFVTVRHENVNMWTKHRSQGTV